MNKLSSAIRTSVIGVVAAGALGAGLVMAALPPAVSGMESARNVSTTMTDASGNHLQLGEVHVELLPAGKLVHPLCILCVM